MLVELTFVSQDDLDGKTFLLHHDDIRLAVPHEMFKDSTVIVGTGAKKIKCTRLVFTNGHTQCVRETLEEIRDMVNDR